MGRFKKSLSFKPHAKTIQITALPSSEFDKLPYKNIENDLGFADKKKGTAYIRITPDYEENRDTLNHEMGELLNDFSADEDEFGIRHKSLFSKMGDWVEKTFVPEKVKETVADTPFLNDVISRGWLGPITQRLTEEGKSASDKGTGTAGLINKATMAALGLVPGVGPLLAAGYGVGQAPNQDIMTMLMGGLEGYGLGSLGSGLGGGFQTMLSGGSTPYGYSVLGSGGQPNMLESFLGGFKGGMGNYLNAPGAGGLWGVGGKTTDLISNLLGGFGGGSNLVNASYKDPTTGQMVNQMFNPSTGGFTSGTGGGSNWFQNILGNLTGGGGGQGGGGILNNILGGLFGGGQGSGGLSSNALQGLLATLLGGQGQSYPNPPQFQTASDLYTEALNRMKTEFPLASQARETALGNINQILSDPNAFYSKYQPTSLEQATANNLFQTNLEQAKRVAGQRASMSGIETIFPELFSKAISPTITGIGEYLGNLGQTRATQGLGLIGDTLGIDPYDLSYLNLAGGQSNLQTGVGYENQLAEYLKKQENATAKTSTLSTIGSDIFENMGLVKPTTSFGSNDIQNIFEMLKKLKEFGNIGKVQNVSNIGLGF